MRPTPSPDREGAPTVSQGGRRTRDVGDAERLLEMVEALAHVGHFRLGPSRLDWSDEVYRIHGYDPGAIVPSPDLGFAAYHPDDRPFVAERMLRPWPIGATSRSRRG